MYAWRAWQASCAATMHVYPIALVQTRSSIPKPASVSARKPRTTGRWCPATAHVSIPGIMLPTAAAVVMIVALSAIAGSKAAPLPAVTGSAKTLPVAVLMNTLAVARAKTAKRVGEGADGTKKLRKNLLDRG